MRVLSVPRVDDHDWSTLTQGERLRQLELLGAVRPLFEADKNLRIWDFRGGNKAANMRSEAPGINPSRWEQN